MSRKIGVFGGTFDPVHVGHLILTEFVRDALSLDQVLFVPAFIPPHKQGATISPGERRLTMVELAIAGNDRLAASDVELKRGGVSYTVDTLADLAKACPDDELTLLVGADNLHDLPNWRRPAELVSLARIAAVRRPGNPPVDWAVLPMDLLTAGVGFHEVEIPLIEVSSTMIRERRRQGKSIRYLTPAAVEAYLDHHGLYREPPVAHVPDR